MNFINSDELTDAEKKKILLDDPIKHMRIKENDDWYFADTEYLTNSHMKELEKSPLHLIEYQKKQQNLLEEDEEEKAEHIWGRAHHCSILEPNEYDKRFATLDDREICKKIGGTRPRGTNDYKAWFTENEKLNNGKTMVKVADYDNIMRIRDKILSIGVCRDILSNTYREMIYYKIINGVKVKVKPDAYRPANYGLELKSIKEPANVDNFRYLLRKYGWNRQCALYKNVLEVPSYYFIVSEKTSPHLIGIYEISEGVIEEGRMKYEKALHDYKMYFVENRVNENEFIYMDRV